jgi:hypothetical protein
MEEIKIIEAVVLSWNEAEELNSSLSNLTDDEIIQCKNALIQRTKNIMSLLDKFITAENLNKYLDL